MQRYLPTVLTAVAFGLASLAASAQGTTVAADAQVRAAADATAVETPAGTQAERKVSDRNCLRHTGSLIQARDRSGKRDCKPAVGRAYTRDDIDSTGATNIADALRRLDPAVY